MIDDYVQDGLDLLDKSGAGYFVIIPFGKRTISYWHLSPEQKQQMIEAFEDGWLSETIINQLKTSLQA